MPRFPKRSDTGTYDPLELAKYTDSLWRSYDPFYDYAAKRWKRVMDFLRGNHWRTLEEFDIDRMPTWWRFPIVGLTLGVYSDLFEQWLLSQVRFSALPTSGDFTDIYRAEQGEQALVYLWEHLDFPQHKVELGAWLLSCGCGTLLTYWNTDTGNLLPLAVPEMAETIDEETGQPTQVPTGNIIPVNPETLQPDPSMSEPVLMDAGDIGIETIGPDMARWGQRRRDGLMVGQMLTEEEAEDRYGTMSEKLRFSAQRGTLDLSWLGMPRIGDAEDRRALVIRHFLPRSYRHPDGLWWESSGETMLSTPAPLPGGRIPGVPFRWVPVQGYHAYGLSPLYEVTYSNKAKDAVRKRQEEWMERVVPKLMLMNGGGVTVEDVRGNEPFEVIEGVNPGAVPTILDPPGFPAEFVRMDQDAAQDALLALKGPPQRRGQERVISGQPRRGVQQPKTTEDLGDVKLPLLTASNAWAEVGRVLLSFVGQFYTTERTVSIQGPDKAYQWLTFTGTDFKNLAASIRVDEVPLYPWARQSLRESVISLLQTEGGQLFFVGEDGKLDRQKLQQASEAVGLNVALSTLSPDVNEARNEISLIRAGQPVEYRPYQNSETHLAEKLAVVKSMAFKGWPEQSQQMMLQNIGQHQQALQEQQQQEENALLRQELALRTIRAQVETEGEVKQQLSQALLDIVKEIMLPKETTTKE